MNRERLVEQYFSGKLSNEDFENLKVLIEADAEFRDNFYHQLEIQQTISQGRNTFLKDRFKALDQKTQEKPTPKWYRYAAVVAMLIGIGLGYIFLNGQTNYQDLYADNFEPYPNVVAPTVRGASEQVKGTMEEAFFKYDSKQYDQAADLFLELYNSTKEDYAYFYHNISLMANGQIKKATANLEGHRWKSSQQYQMNSNWYIALGYLKLEDKTNAIKYFEKVANSKTSLANSAQELLLKLH